MKRISLWLVLVLLVVCLCGNGATAQAEEESATPASEAEYLEDFTVETVGGGTFTLSEELADHKLVLINLFATWCEPCWREFPFLQEAWQQRADQVSIIALSTYAMDDMATLTAFATDRKLNFPMGNVGDTGLDRFVEFMIPVTLVVDHSGRVLAAETGAKFSVEEFYELFDRYTDESYDSNECTYTVYACDMNGGPLQGAQISFSTDTSCAVVTSGTDGYAIFTGPAARYRVEVAESPKGTIPYTDKVMKTNPFSYSFSIYFEQDYVPRVDEDEEPIFNYTGPEPEWIILDDFSVDTIDGGIFTLSEVMKDHKLLLVKLFTTNSMFDEELPFLQKALKQRGDKVAMLALSIEPEDSLETLKDYADRLGVSFPMGREEGTGLGRFVTDSIPLTILVDSQRRVLMVDWYGIYQTDDIHDLLDRYSGINYNPYECAYQIFTLDNNGNPVAGVVFNVCTEESCITYTTNEMGGIYFTALPRRYHIQLVSAPNGLTVSGPDEWITEPYPQNVYFTLAD